MPEIWRGCGLSIDDSQMRLADCQGGALQAGSQVNAQTDEGWSALHLAAKDCRLHVVNALLAAKADPSLVDVHCCTALHYAARMGDMTLFQSLYRRASDFFRLRDVKGWLLA